MLVHFGSRGNGDGSFMAKRQRFRLESTGAYACGAVSQMAAHLLVECSLVVALLDAEDIEWMRLVGRRSDMGETTQGYVSLLDGWLIHIKYEGISRSTRFDV